MLEGLLLGLDLDGTLEVSNSFALPHHVSDEDEKSAKSSGMKLAVPEIPKNSRMIQPGIRRQC